MDKVLNHPNHQYLLANILKFIINDCVNMFRVCKIVSIDEAEHLAQYYVGLQDNSDFRLSEDREYIRKCIHQYKDDPTSLFDGAWYEYRRLNEMVYAVRNGADLINNKTCVLNLVADAIIDPLSSHKILEIFKFLMAKGHSYLNKFVGKWRNQDHHEFRFKFPTCGIHFTDVSRELINLLWSGPSNPISIYWYQFDEFVITHCMDFVSREDVYTLLSPSEKYSLTFTRKIESKGINYYYDVHETNEPCRTINLNQHWTSQVAKYPYVDPNIFGKWIDSSTVELTLSLPLQNIECSITIDVGELFR